MSSTYNGAARTMPLSIPEPRRPVETLAKVLASQRAAVVDVVPGATHASRRLLVGQLLGGRLTHVVAVAAQDDLDPLDSEQRVLSGMPPVSEQLAATLPQAVGRVEVPKEAFIAALSTGNAPSKEKR